MTICVKILILKFRVLEILKANGFDWINISIEFHIKINFSNESGTERKINILTTTFYNKK